MEKFYETIFLKSDSTLESKLDNLKRINKINNDEYYMLQKGINGEKQVQYHLGKSNIGMYALRDINLKCEDLKAQVDFVLVTSHHCYFVECKNYNADIIHVDETRNFEMSTRYGKKYNKMGIKSPLSQVDDQLNVFKKICLNNQEQTKELLNGIRFKDYFKTMVVFTNPENRLNIKKAPRDIKYRILKVDNLIRQIEYDDKHYTGKRLTKTQIENMANYILSNNVQVEIEQLEPIEYVEPIEMNRTNKKQGDSPLSNLKNGLIKFIQVMLILYLIAAISSCANYIDQNNDNHSNTQNRINSTR